MNGKQKIILDCDPGHDDAVAIMLAGKSEKLELCGITVVSGNQTLEKTTKNALDVCQCLKLDVPVFSGCAGPIVREQRNSPEIHGDSGLDGPVFEPLKRKAEDQHAVLFIVDTLMRSDGDIIVVTTGPMTNLGMALRMEPRIAEKIQRIVLMGGAIENGNVTPAAEFNIFADPEAAYICFTCGCPVTMVGLDVTRKVLCYPEIVERMGKVGNRASQLFVDMMAHFCRTQKEIFGYEGGPLHDPLTIAYLIDPGVIQTQKMNVRIDIRSEQSRGRTNCDRFDYLHLPQNADVAVGVDPERFWNIIEAGLRKYD